MPFHNLYLLLINITSNWNTTFLEVNFCILLKNLHVYTKYRKVIKFWITSYYAKSNTLNLDQFSIYMLQK